LKKHSHHYGYHLPAVFEWLVGAAAVEITAHDGFVNIDIPIPDLQVKATIRIGADPGFVVNGCPLTTEVRQGYQFSGVALQTLGEISLLH
jgi:hypothetical protein